MNEDKMLRLFFFTLALLFPLAAHAAPILEYEFSASYLSKTLFGTAFDESSSAAANQAEAMGSLTGTIHFSNSLSATFPTAAHYAAPVITIDGLSPPDQPIALTATIFSGGPTGNDAITVGNEGISTNGLLYHAFFWLLDESGSYFDGGFVFPDLIELSAFSQTTFTVQSTNWNGSTSNSTSKATNFTINSLTPVAAVPLPAGLPLLGATLAGLALIRRKKA